MDTVRDKILNALTLFYQKIKSIFVQTTNVVNNCASTSTSYPLSAAQGKNLQGQIDNINSTLDELSGDMSDVIKSNYTQYFIAGNEYNISLQSNSIFLITFYSSYNVGAVYIVQTGNNANAKISALVASDSYITATATSSTGIKLITKNANFTINAIRLCGE